MDLDKDINLADTELVGGMRPSIIDVLREIISLDRHLSPEEPVSGIDIVLKDLLDSESLQEKKRTRFN